MLLSINYCGMSGHVLCKSQQDERQSMRTYVFKEYNNYTMMIILDIIL